LPVLATVVALAVALAVDMEVGMEDMAVDTEVDTVLQEDMVEDTEGAVALLVEVDSEVALQVDSQDEEDTLLGAIRAVSAVLVEALPLPTYLPPILASKSLSRICPGPLPMKIW
jgi:hypothetical protein